MEEKMDDSTMVEGLRAIFLNSVFPGVGHNKTDGFKKFVAEVLGNIKPNEPYGTKLFDALARLSWSVAMEAIALRRNLETKELEIFLRKRSDDDTAYPGEWHAPGSVFRPGETERQVAGRLSKEFGAPIVEFKKISDVFNPTEERGSFLSLIYLVEFSKEQPPKSDERHGWFSLNDLPEKMVKHHVDEIFPPAISAYLQ